MAALLPVGVAWVGKLIVDAVVSGFNAVPGPARDESKQLAVFWVLIELALVASIGLIERLLTLLRQLVASQLAIDINILIMEKALTLDLRQFENPNFYDKLTRARREASSRPLSLVQANLQILRSALTLGGYAVILTRFDAWAVGVLLLAAVPVFFIEARFSGKVFNLRNSRSPESRRLRYFEHVVGTNEHAKEVKLFGLGPLLLDRYRKLAETLYAEERRLGVNRVGWTFILSLVSTGAFYGYYVAVVLATVGGRLSLGDLTLYVTAFRQAQSTLRSALSALGGMYENNLYMANLFEFLNIPTIGRRTGGAQRPERAELGIRFEKVSFRYDNNIDWALRDVNLFIPQGESIALVGENGAGKTTIIKLLTRLYHPTEGAVFLDGRDLADWDEAALRRRIGIIYQDFNRYQFAIRENVGFGCVECLYDDKRIRRAVDLGGASELVAALSAGLDTQLGRWFDDGAELSGGQWQKIALSRAFVREDADILVLDEPTASLDAIAEHASFERFRALSRGRTTILVSHRFPTVRMANQIFVLEHGRIVEQGTHADLLVSGARYAGLFALQAEGYR